VANMLELVMLHAVTLLLGLVVRLHPVAKLLLVEAGGMYVEGLMVDAAITVKVTLAPLFALLGSMYWYGRGGSAYM